MFKPNLDCFLDVASGKTDVYGTALPGTRTRERCSIVKLTIVNQKSAVRADTSASRGSAREFQSDAVILMRPTSGVKIDDTVELLSYKLLVNSVFPRHDVTGRLDHIEVGCSFWSAK